MNNNKLEYYDDKNLDVKVLLSTYNGELFLEEQLDSLVNQDYFSYKIVIRDDGSKDKTIDILRNYKQKFPTIIELIDLDSNINLGVKGSFELLMQSVDADCYFFCDQDDIWESDKISNLVSLLIQEQEKHGDLPLLAFSDFRIFKEDEVIIKSYYKKINFGTNDIKNKIFMCVIPGCCFCFNQNAKKLYFEYSTEYLHDGHLFLLMQLFGTVLPSRKALINYRLHANNLVGYWKQNKMILLIKDFVKFFRNKSAYRTSVLSDYDSNVRLLYDQIDNEFLRTKELYLLSEVNNLSFFSRKKWYVNHFKPFKKGIFQGIMEILTF